MSDLTCSWHRAALALALLRIDPAGLGGAIIRMRASPLRDRVIAEAQTICPALRQVHPAISDTQLMGGLDVAATLRSGQRQRSAGLLDGAPILLTMAERTAPDLAAKLALAMDDGRIPTLIALDEGIEDGCPPALTDRAAFQIAPEGRVPPGWSVPTGYGGAAQSSPEDAEALAALSLRLGIDSARAPLFALRAARAHAGLHGRTEVAEEDLAAAAALVLAHRATRLPEEEAETPDAPAENTAEGGTSEDADLPEGDMLVDAVQAVLPPDILASLRAPRAPRAAGSGAGAQRTSNRRGRPLPPRPGRLGGVARIDLIATLRAAAPWQAMRRAAKPDAPGLLIRAEDIRLKRFAEHSDRVLIFAVDASGSAAVARLGEAKGAIELLLGAAYAKRDHVALIAFRGQGAEPLLTPTRSLVQTKRQLADLPGGGGTPLAAGLRSAFELGRTSAARGMSPTLVLLTDGRANIALDGQADRGRAGADARDIARLIRGAALPGVVIDTGKRPGADLRRLAADMDAPYVPLPRADAASVSAAVGAVMTHG